LKGTTQDQEVRHELFYFRPIYDNVGIPCEYTLEYASSLISRIIEQRIVDKSDSESNKLAFWLKGHYLGAQFLGWLFEGYCNEKLKAGGNLNLVHNAGRWAFIKDIHQYCMSLTPITRSKNSK
jgi:hypothetical protein